MALIGFGLLGAGPAPAETIDTASIIASALTPACLRIEVVGTCFWLVCTPLGCDVESSLKVRQYNPDLVVSTANGLGKMPWIEMRAVLSGVETAAATAVVSGQGGPTAWIDATGDLGSAPPSHEQRGRANVGYFEAQAIGHPAAGRFYCPSTAQPFLPYYLSGLDALGWRWSVPELLYPEAWTPGVREIGAWPLNTWGSVYPRHGWLTHSDVPKTSAVLAQRVGDIVTRSGQPRIYHELRSDSGEVTDGKLVWLPPTLTENSSAGGDWQMLVPAMSSSCEVFGKNDSVTLTGWAGGKVSSSGEYAWTLWRPYECCEIKGIFIGDISF